MRIYAPLVLIALALAGCTPTGVADTLTAPPTGTLSQLTVNDGHAPSGYVRSLFGTAWADTDHNGCDQREDVLIRDTGAVKTTRKGSCYADASAIHYASPYTGQVLTVRATIQIDHIVPLGDAWKSGANAWTPAQRLAFATDETNLWAVDGKSNEAKSDKTPDAWKPPLHATWCAYAQRYIASKVKYHLSVTSASRDALGSMLGTCSG
jgi:hypothetical protein